ncbi:aryl-alcohol dehydrogenase-like predicted oxidoreductase [Kitasatospora sp. MAP12-15]|uniref:aldo/keto reductase n=1 Tax=unclassified Kitasatospora TaxID=2633591 RepID=UPI002474A7AE|nr:aldo/keto reductase [Kitasatospora sp. MAP12-44]MDH6113914.1 aryl-alcohol dehydrogenase-like predicted oxidoreductase [Kitasatospora sp. MAP12-44]
MSFEHLLAAAPTPRFGLGLAALGRPGYINLGRAEDLPVERTVSALRERAHEVLDAAYAQGVRYLDAARSYGRSEEFLAEWLERRPEVGDVVVGSKWGYTYTADWRADAQVHEVKDHSVQSYDRQVAESRSLLGKRLDLYQIHSVTPDSPALTDPVLHRRLAGLAAEGVRIGLSTSGPSQADAIRAALTVTVDGEPLFRSVQATYNLLEPSAGDALAAAHDAGCLVIVKEGMANGRLAGRATDAVESAVLRRVAEEAGAGCDAVALAAVLHQPWADVVLSGAATVDQLGSNLRAAAVQLDADQLAGLATLAEPARAYWQHRSGLPWS